MSRGRQAWQLGQGRVHFKKKAKKMVEAGLLGPGSQEEKERANEQGGFGRGKKDLKGLEGWKLEWKPPPSYRRGSQHAGSGTDGWIYTGPLLMRNIRAWIQATTSSHRSC